MKNLILLTDSYKTSQYVQYPEGTTEVYSYIESRGGRYSETVFFGLQYYLEEYLSKPITKEDIDEAEIILKDHMPNNTKFNREGWEYILEKHNGYLPLEIKAVAEGTLVSVKNVLVTVVNTDPKCFWLTSYVETLLLKIWYPITVASQSNNIRNIIMRYLQETSDMPDQEIEFKLHDFGARGVSSSESGMIGGMSHLVNFLGTDTLEAVVGVKKYYQDAVLGFSIPASEHSTMTSWGKENEEAAYRNMLKQFGKEGSLLAVVSDSYDIYNAIENIWGGSLKKEVIESGATVVIRPDSGVPKDVCLAAAKLIEDKFGITYNTKGFKVFNHVRLIQGDGVNEDSIREILQAFVDEGYSATNIAFGMGGALLQKVDRDTQKFAMKCSSIKVNGKDREVFKDPITDKGKSSKKGKMSLVKETGKPHRTEQGSDGHFLNVLQTVFLNGKITKRFTMKDVRKNLRG